MNSLLYKNNFVGKPFMLHGKAKTAVQPKLTTNTHVDRYEQEADAMADKVMRMPIPEPISFSISKTVINRKCSECEKEEELQRKESNSETGSTAPSIVQDVLSSPGRSLDTGTRSFMEPRFNYISYII